MSTDIARKYGLSLEVVDLHKEYWENVAAYAIDKIKKGLTPNPDVMCNKLIKFGCFEQQVGKNFDFTATGHYATTIRQDGKTWLGTAKDPVKDQTDFLAQIDYLQVSKLMFSIGRPEFLNRLDDIIVFKQLTEPQVRQIVDLDVKQLNDRLFDRHMSLELTDAAKDLLAQKGFDPLLGARPLRRVIQRDVEDAISEKILMGELEDGQRVKVDAEGEGILGEFTFTGEAFEEPNTEPAEGEVAAETEAPAESTESTELTESAESVE